MKNVFTRPDWAPKAEKGARILIIGATGGLGKALVSMLLENSDCVIGAHGSSQTLSFSNADIILLNQTFKTDKHCRAVVEEFSNKAGGLDALVILSGSILFSGHWMDMTGSDWEREIAVNLNQPFFLAQSAMAQMKKQMTGGRIILTGTESALHGGSSASFPYAVAKRGTEGMVQGLAREGAPHNILVNGIRLGYIKSGFHERWHGRSKKDMRYRADLVPLKRGGDPDEVAAIIIYLLSGYGSFITGQMLPLTGGDWL
ncbi:SDR family oxidoreductase [Rhodospirillales bacterium]|nr:SDR family oxidoreductase [Rhodospirillales bacterium]